MSLARQLVLLGHLPHAVRLTSTTREAVRDGFIWVVGALACALLVFAWTLDGDGPWTPWLICLVFAASVVTERLSVPLPRGGEVPISTIPHLFAVLVLPAWLAMIIVGAAMLVDQIYGRKPIRRLGFNVASIMVTTGAAALLAYRVGLNQHTLGRAGEWQQLPELLLVMVCYYVVTNGLVATIVSLSTGVSAHRAFLDNALFSVPAEFAVCGIGGLIALVWVESPFWTPLVLFPAVISQVAIKYIVSANQKSDALRHQAQHDALTGLPNRSMLSAGLAELLTAPPDKQGAFSLLLLDLDRFKEVNDTFGHHHGDVLLRQVGERVRSALRTHDLLARVGGDEFALLLPGADARAAVSVAEAVLRTVEKPFTVEGDEFQVGVSIGVAAYPQHGDTAEELMRLADIAMYAAKRDHLGMVVYTAQLVTPNPERITLYGELRQAIERQELRLHFQPKLDLHSGQVCGVEALVRWEHPIRGLLSPDKFIAFAQRTGLIRPLGLWVLEAAALQCRTWRDIGLDLSVAINFTAADLQDASMPQRIARVLAKHDLPAAKLRIEITESTFMADQKRAHAVLGALRGMGVRVAIDDFGTGYSSLAYLKQLPADEVKIDQSFVHDLATDRGDAAIVRSIITLSHDLGLLVTAEGVENAESLRLLQKFGCDETQGYYTSRPLDSDALIAWIRKSGLRGINGPMDRREPEVPAVSLGNPPLPFEPAFPNTAPHDLEPKEHRYSGPGLLHSSTHGRSARRRAR